MNSVSPRQPLNIAEFQDVRSRIEEWRASRSQRGPMPAVLWKEAVHLARIHGINAVARALRLAYYDLKKRVVAVVATERPMPKPSFVEVAVKGRPGSADAVVEIERSDGAHLRIRALSQEAVIALTEVFLRGRE